MLFSSAEPEKARFFFAYVRERSAVNIVVSAKLVHRLAELSHINERSYDNQRSENTPAPVGTGAEAVIDTAALKLAAYAVRHLVLPNDTGDAKGDRCEKKEDQAKVHSLLAVISRCDRVEILTDTGIKYNTIDTERDNCEQNCLHQISVGIKLSNWRGIHNRSTVHVVKIIHFLPPYSNSLLVDKS